MTLGQFAMWIQGEEITTVHTSDVINPSNGQKIADVPIANRNYLNSAIRSAREAFPVWSEMSPAQRQDLLYRLAQKIDEKGQEFAQVETLQTGKPIRMTTTFDVPFSVDNLKFFAGCARSINGIALANYTPECESVVRREPIGVVGSIVPWNYPLNMAIWKIGPALAAGNTVILKPASLTPLTALMIGRLATEVGFPDGVLNVVTGPGGLIGKTFSENPEVDLISLTGDTATGKQLMQMCAPQVKRLHLELGGKAPFIVFADADLGAAVQGAVMGAFINGGQDCTAATRIYVQDSTYHEFTDRFINRVMKLRVGDPLSEATDIGPLISFRHRDKVENFVKRAIADGATCLLGGTRPNVKSLNSGAYFSPTILAVANNSAEVVQNEIFGPVVVVMPFKTEEEAIVLANNTRYGLAASVWTTNSSRSSRVAAKIRAGTVWINEHAALISEMPHGGYKQSGFGKDLSMFSFEEYMNIKHVMRDISDKIVKPWHYLS